MSAGLVTSEAARENPNGPLVWFPEVCWKSLACRSIILISPLFHAAFFLCACLSQNPLFCKDIATAAAAK